MLLVAVPAAGSDRVAADPAAIDRFILNGPLFLPGTATVPMAAIRSLAELERETVRRVANRLDPIKVDEFRTFIFDGLEIYGYVGDRQELWPIRITVTRPSWKIQDGLTVGSDASRVTAQLGAPNETTANALMYRTDTQSVNFYFDAGRIVKVEFIYYSD
jgi:hypothetical protein